MTRRTDDRDDADLRAILRRYDPITPIGLEGLAELEGRILAQVDSLPEDFRYMIDLPPPVWTRAWAVPGACMLAVLFIILGFAAGREFSEPSSAQATLLASVDETAWQSFITAPSGETDDASQ